MRELELKFSVHDPFTLPDLAADGSTVSAVSRIGRATMRATYYDTDDLRLARAGITLRRRTGGKDAGWHLKLPVAGERQEARDEIALPLNGAGVPAPLRELVTAYARGAALRPVTTLRTVRESYRLDDAGGNQIAELVDDTVSILEGSAVMERFRELEIESQGAGIRFLRAVGKELVAAGAVQGTFMPKAVRALGSRALAPADVPAPDEVNKDSTAGEVVTAFLRTHVAALVRNDPLVRQDAEDAVHQMRVACRRLRSGLKTFAPLVDAEWAERVRAELAWLASALGDARDTEVMRERFVHQLGQVNDDAARAEVTALIERSLAAAQRKGAASMRAALGSTRYVELLDTLVAACASVPLTDAAGQRARAALPPLAARAWRRLEKVVESIDSDSPPELLHRARILAKQARYASEACSLAFGKPARALAAQITRLQDLFGEHQDAQVAAAMVERLARTKSTRDSSQIGYALGMLYSMQLQAADTARGELRAVWSEVRKRRLRVWLEQ